MEKLTELPESELGLLFGILQTPTGLWRPITALLEDDEGLERAVARWI
jgi:hypothetical protein